MEITYRVKGMVKTFSGEAEDLAELMEDLHGHAVRALEEAGVSVSGPDTFSARLINRYFETVSEGCDDAELGDLEGL